MTLQNYNFDCLLTPVKLLSTVNITGSYNNGSINNGVDSFITVPFSTFSVDLVEVEIGDTVLLINQTNSNENGIYICIQTGGIYSFSVLQRRPDFHSVEQIRAGQFISISDGAINKGQLYTVVTPLPNFLGIDPLFFIASSPSFRRIEFDETDFSDATNVIVEPGIVGIAAFSGTYLKFNNPINVDGNTVANQIVGTASIIENNGVTKGIVNVSASGLKVNGILEQQSFNVVNGISIDLSDAEVNQATVVGQVINISTIQTPTDINSVFPRAVFNNSGISLRGVETIIGQFDYLFTASSAANYYVPAGVGAGQAGDVTKCNAKHVLKLDINGDDRFIPLFETN